MRRHINGYRYKNITFLLVSLVITYLLFRTETIHGSLLQLGDWGYIGALLAGVMFVSTFTVAVGSVILLILAEQYPIVDIAVLAGLGAVIGDLTIFRYVRAGGLLKEIKLFTKHLGGGRVRHLFRTRYFAWTLPVVGALIIASPLPDEVGVSLLGISRMKMYKFLILSFILNSFGIMLVLSAALLVKP